MFTKSKIPLYAAAAITGIAATANDVPLPYIAVGTFGVILGAGLIANAYRNHTAKKGDETMFPAGSLGDENLSPEVVAHLMQFQKKGKQTPRKVLDYNKALLVMAEHWAGYSATLAIATNAEVRHKAFSRRLATIVLWAEITGVSYNAAKLELRAAAMAANLGELDAQTPTNSNNAIEG